MPYRIVMKNKYTGSVENIDDEIYETKSDADDALDDTVNDYLTGAEVLDLAGESLDDSDNFDFYVKKVK